MATEVISREAQREFPRWPVPATKAVRVDLGPAGSSQLIDISMSGMRVKSLAPLRRDSELPVSLNIPDAPPLRCSGIVVWSKPNGAAGLRFVKLSDDQKATLRAWIAELEQAASDKAHPTDEFTRITTQVKNMKLNNADALSLIVRRVAQLANATGVVIALGKPENMICLARTGDAPELGTVIHPDLGLTAECVRSRKPVTCHDASSDPRATEIRQGSALIEPLLISGQLRGVMQVFSARPQNFDAKCSETVEKLADAVLFVTHNFMPQRLATVTPMPKPAASSAPPVLKPSDSGRLNAFPAASRPTAAAPARIEPIAPVSPLELPTAPPATVTPLADPVETPVRLSELVASQPQRELPDNSRGVIRRTAAAPPIYSLRPQPSRKWIISIPLVVIMIASASGIYLKLHHHKQSAGLVASSAPAATHAAAPVAATTSPATTAAPATSVAAAATPPVEAPPLKSAKPTAEVKPLETARKIVPVKEEPPQPAPLVLAASAPVALPHTDDADAPPPAAPEIQISGGGSMPRLAMPAASAAPRLTARVVKPLTGGTLVEQTQPVYPRSALISGIEGQVKLHAIINTKGTLDDIRRISGPPLLAGAAIEAVKRWRYEPFRADGVPVSRETTIVLNFRIPR